jgi:hypothetical protein
LPHETTGALGSAEQITDATPQVAVRTAGLLQISRALFDGQLQCRLEHG